MSKILITIKSRKDNGDNHNSIPVSTSQTPHKSSVTIILKPKDNVQMKQKSNRINLIITQRIKCKHPVETRNQSNKVNPKSKEEKIKLPEQLCLETFYYYGNQYWIDTTSNYIFLPSDIDNHHYQPVGQLIDKSSEANKTSPDLYLLPNKYVEWYFYYDSDLGD